MKTDRPYKTIEEIYREQFRNFEVSPGKGFWPRFEKKLRIREFVRFTPGRFNVFYLGAVVAGIAVITLSVLLKDRSSDQPSGSDRPFDELPAGKAEKTEVPDSIELTQASKGSAAASGRVVTINQDNKVLNDTSATFIREEQVVESIEISNSDIEKDIKVGDSKILSRDELIRPSPSAGFEIDNISGCIPLRVSFTNLSANYDSCMWEFGDGGYSKEAEPIWIFDEEGEYTVKLIVFGNNGQAASRTGRIDVYPLPVARFEVNTGDPMLPDEQVKFYNYSENSVKWKWDFGDGQTSMDFEPYHQYERYGSYSVKLYAISKHGCIDSLIITDAFGENSCYLKFPNAFVPNDGGPTGGYYSNRTDIESEVFHPVWSGVTEYNLRIFTRSGLMIFETDDINIGWDGYHKGQKVDPGVYIWKVRGVFKNGDPFVQAGDITLLPRR